MNMKHRTSRSTGRSGFTLLELVAATTVMSIIAAVVMPIIVTATDSYAVSRDTRADTDRVLYALERAARVVREAPMTVDGSGLDAQTATSTSFIFTDGSGLRINGTDFELLKSGGQASVLCSDVDQIRFNYFDSAGNPLSPIDPARVHRVNLQIRSGPVTLDMYTLPRAWIGAEG